MKFLHFLIPRFVLMGTLCLGLWMSSALLARYAVRHSDGQLSRDIDTDEVLWDWNERSVTMSNVTLGNPDTDPMYLEMDKLTLKLDPEALVGRRLVVRDGVVTNLHLIDTRLKSHEQHTQDQEASAFTGAAEVVRETLSDKLEAAIKQAKLADKDYGVGVLPGNTWWQAVSQSLAVGRPVPVTLKPDFKQRWLAEFQQREKQVVQLQQQIAEVQQLANRPSNPLRAHGMTLQVQQQLTQLTTELADVQSDLMKLQSQAIAELNIASQAAAQSARASQALSALPGLHAPSIAKQVLSQQETQQLQAMLKWVDWAGNLVPNLKLDPQALRGRNVSFGDQQPPSLQVDQLTLVGMTDVGGSYYRFMGRLNQFTNDPENQQQPATLSLRAQGPQHVIVNAVYDRRAGEKTDIDVKTPDLIQAETRLPATTTENSLGLELVVAPSTAFSQIHLTLEGSKITGQVVVQHHNTRIQLAEGQIEDATLAGMINYELADCDQYETVYQLEGDVDHIVATPSCDLADQIASAFQAATESHVAKLLDLKAMQSQAIAQKELDDLNQWVSTTTRQISTVIESGQSQIASIQGTVQQSSDATLRLR